MKPFLLALLATFLAVAARADEPIAIGSRRELFVDRLLAGEMRGAGLRLHHPQPAEVAIRFDQPWEGIFSAYVTVIHDEKAGKYLMFYRGNFDRSADGGAGEATCYAESPDGIRWTKPNLGLHEVAGSRNNNVMLANMAPYTHNFAPFLDRRPGVPGDERFKALAGLGGKFGGLCAFASGDGLHWRKLHNAPVLTRGAFDSQNVSFWSETEQKYIAYFRIFTGGGMNEKTGKPRNVRWVSRATSDDFIHWSDATPMICDQPLVDDIYISQTRPYFRAPHLYVATAARFMPGKAVLDVDDKKTLAAEAKAYPALVKDCSEAVLMTSRAGGTKYNRTFMDGWVRPGLGFRNWTSRSNYPACGIVPTGDAEMSIYVERQYGQKSAYLQRLTMRTDGFASVHADYVGGEMTTQPLTFAGRALHINLATGVAGSVAVELRDERGEPIPGFSHDDCKRVTGDAIDRVIEWKGGSDLSQLAGKPVRLRLVLKDADVFSFAFLP